MSSLMRNSSFADSSSRRHKTYIHTSNKAAIVLPQQQFLAAILTRCILMVGMFKVYKNDVLYLAAPGREA